MRTVAAWLPPVVILGAFAGRRWWQMGALPPGVDGGQWLALGRDAVGTGRSTDGAYAPLVPILVQAARVAVGPLDALRFVAVGALLAVLFAVYAVARDGLGPRFALAAAATVGLASAVAEPVAYGGYPQHAAFAGLLLSALTLARFLVDGRRRDGLTAAAALALAALAHHVYFPLAVAACGLVGLAWLSTRPPRRAVLRRGAAAAGAVAVGAACFLPTALAFRAAGYEPPLDANRLGLAEAFRYGTREAPGLWGLIAVAGIAALAVTARDRRQTPTWQAAVALTAAALGLFLPSAQVRLLPPLLAGATLGVAIGLHAVAGRCRGRLPAALPLAAAAALPLLLWPGADAQAAAYFRYYRVLDAPLVGAAEAIRAARPDGLVAVRHNRRGWPVGWWFEGLTEARLAVGSDPRWLGFPAERARAELAGRFFDRPLTGAQLAALADETGVDLLVFRKWEWIGWQRWLDDPDAAVEIRYDDGTFMVLDVTKSAVESRQSAGGW